MKIGSRPLRVVVADPDEGIRIATSFILEEDGFKVVHKAESALQAVFASLEERPDLVVLNHDPADPDTELIGDLAGHLGDICGVIALSSAADATVPWADAWLSKDQLHRLSGVLRVVAVERHQD